MAYVQGFVAAVPAANKEAYRQHAAGATALFREFGVIRMVEAWGDDVPDGKVTDFKGAVKAQPGEVIVFAWHEYASKAAALAAFEKMMSDPRMEDMGTNMPFDAQRMIYGGFVPIIEAGAVGAMGYLDGSLLAVPEANKDAYRDLTIRQAAILMEYGATRVVDGWGDDVPDGKVTDFKGAVKATSDETVVFSWIEWPSKAVRDQAWGKVFADPRMHSDTPYDAQRWVHGGFAPILDA
ncbi:DUF1428 domain-containing protein [Phenylobacterium sp. Root700]|uniref:DUF1428 domain-containing protein n=1 Tax=Phenylobacterium sp. Root700 TaxID=1736591 RepID=UPI0006FF66FB|nr:DUF1428 domain-containing protein [Phenylobacterium sp. Root700]KRB40452.1 hypothetical protein ASE02_07035 [Phenylobacterium sp. Root700]